MNTKDELLKIIQDVHAEDLHRHCHPEEVHEHASISALNVSPPVIDDFHQVSPSNLHEGVERPYSSDEVDDEEVYDDEEAYDEEEDCEEADAFDEISEEDDDAYQTDTSLVDPPDPETPAEEYHFPWRWVVGLLLLLLLFLLVIGPLGYLTEEVLTSNRTEKKVDHAIGVVEQTIEKTDQLEKKVDALVEQSETTMRVVSSMRGDIATLQAEQHLMHKKLNRHSRHLTTIESRSTSAPRVEFHSNVHADQATNLSSSVDFKTY